MTYQQTTAANDPSLLDAAQTFQDPSKPIPRFVVQAPPPELEYSQIINVQTDFTYGITATGRSWLAGILRLVRMEHAKMLAFKVCTPKLPKELIDAVADGLCALDVQVIRTKTESDPKSFQWHWETEKARNGLPADQEVQRQIDQTGVYVSTLRHDEYEQYNISPEFEGLVLLQASRVRPTIGQINVAGPEGVRSQQNTRPPRDFWQCERIVEARGYVYATTKPPPYWSDNNCWDEALFFPADKPAPRNRRIRRFLHCARLEEAIASWDADAATVLVNLLELDVVPASVYDADPMKPSLVAWQGLGVSWPCES